MKILEWNDEGDEGGEGGGGVRHSKPDDVYDKPNYDVTSHYDITPLCFSKRYFYPGFNSGSRQLSLSFKEYILLSTHLTPGWRETAVGEVPWLRTSMCYAKIGASTFTVLIKIRANETAISQCSLRARFYPCKLGKLINNFFGRRGGGGGGHLCHPTPPLWIRI